MTKHILTFLIFYASIQGQSIIQPIGFDMESEKRIVIPYFKAKSGDNDGWKASDLDDSDWKMATFRNLIQHDKGIHWYRTTINLRGKTSDFDVLCLRISSLHSAFEVFWDGMLIYKNGRVGTSKSEEIPGRIAPYIKLNRKWTISGPHLLAIRFSNFHNNQYFFDQTPFWTLMGYYTYLKANLINVLYYNHFTFGLFFLAALFCMALFYAGGRRRPYLFFSLYFLIDAIWHSIPIVIKHFNPSVMWLIPISFFTLISDALLILLLNIFFIYNFKIRRKILHILINLIAILVIFMIEKTSGRLLQLMWFYSVILIIESVSKKRPGSIPALLGVLILLIEPIHIILFNTLPSLRLFHQIINVSFIFFMLLSVSSQIRAQNRERQSSLIRSARLETELLKRNIQPHFLMNTLLSVISLIKESPSKAIRLIDAFADEFRIINRISSKKLIPIDEEIQLCESHLALMEFRKEAHYQFIRSTIDEDEMVPPMIFHTLIENGLTHAFQAGENGTFKLYYKKDENHIQYCLTNDGSRLKSLSDHPGFHIEDGMGLRYVKARLEENFPNKWQMAYHLKNGWWEVNITIER